VTGSEFAAATEAAVVWVGAKFMTSEERWQAAHRHTDEAFGRAAAETLGEAELAELRDRLVELA
jgi:hypothetical protein